MRNVLLVPGLAVIAAISIQMAHSQDPSRNRIALDCIAKVGIDRKVVETAVATAVLPRDNQKYKEFLSCSYKKQGYQDENGEILINNVKKFLEEFYNAVDLEVIDPCKHTNSTSHPEAAFSALDCIMKKIIILNEKST